MIFFFLGSSNGWLVGDSKYIFATHDTGKSWVKYNTKISEDLNQIQFVTELIGWIVSDGGLYKSHDGGITWYSQLGFETISKCYYVNETTGWVIVSSPFYSLLLTKDGGENWSIQISFPSFEPPIWNKIQDIFFINESHGWFLYQEGTDTNYTNNIYYTENSGTNWNSSLLTKDCLINRIFFIDTLNGWAIGTAGEIFYTNNSGHNWIRQYSFTGERLDDVYFLDNLNGWICGTNGTILFTQNGGINWTDFSNSSIQTDFNGIYFFNETVGLVIGSTSDIFISYNGGNQWFPIVVNLFKFGSTWIWLILSFNMVSILILCSIKEI